MAMTEMTFFEAFRFIETFTTSIIQLRDAAETIRVHGSDLKKWETEKAKVLDEIKDLEKSRTLAREERIADGVKGAKTAQEQLVQIAAQKEEALKSIRPALDELKEAKGFVLEAQMELSDISTEKDQLIDDKNSILRVREEEIAMAEQKLADVESKISAIKKKL